MPDYTELHRMLMQEILKQERAMGATAQDFVQRFLAILKRSGYTLNMEAEEQLRKYLGGIVPAITAAIHAAVGIVAGAAVSAPLRDTFIAEQVAAAFARRWPDIRLSERIWRLETVTRQGIEQILRDGARAGTSVQNLVMQMQRAVEATTETRFAIVSRDSARWVDDLVDAGRAVVRTPQARADWLKTLEQVRQYVDGLSDEGTAHGAHQLVSQIEKAVAQGQEDLIDSALEWRIYDKQQANLKRIARSEMSNANHKAVIDSVKGVAAIIGFQWRLTGSHASKKSSPDECDLFADCEWGLGRGVFPVDKVPQWKPHPNCLCVLIPRVGREREQGTVSPDALPL